jgi:co-chaperonin GroES (HSP10)
VMSMDVTKIQPLGHMVLVKVMVGGLSAGGIAIPENASIERRGEVIAVGPGNTSALTGERVRLGVTPGDTVVLNPNTLYVGRKEAANGAAPQSILVKRDGDALYLLVQEGSILAIDRNRSADLVESRLVMQ